MIALSLLPYIIKILVYLTRQKPVDNSNWVHILDEYKIEEIVECNICCNENKKGLKCKNSNQHHLCTVCLQKCNFICPFCTIPFL